MKIFESLQQNSRWPRQIVFFSVGDLALLADLAQSESVPNFSPPTPKSTVCLASIPPSFFSFSSVFISHAVLHRL